MFAFPGVRLSPRSHKPLDGQKTTQKRELDSPAPGVTPAKKNRLGINLAARKDEDPAGKPRYPRGRIAKSLIPKGF
jgi:hypothetical protein